MSEPENNEEVEGPAVVFLENDQGESVPFALLAMFEVQEQEFAVMIPVEQLDDAYEEAAEVFFFHHQDEGDGQFSFSNVDDDDLYGKVQAFCDTLDMDGLVDVWASG